MKSISFFPYLYLSLIQLMIAQVEKRLMWLLANDSTNAGICIADILSVRRVRCLFRGS